MKISKKKLAGILSTVLLIIFIITSCHRDDMFNNDPSFRLTFSSDTIMFDTVFTTVGSVTKIFKVYNNSSKDVLISSIELASGQSSDFRFNADGRPGIKLEEVLLRANDSLWIFTEVTVDPNDQSNPLLIQDSLLFYVNGNRQTIQLLAFGQDAYFHIPTIPATNDFPAYGLLSGVLPTDKPHVIYGLSLVPNDSTLIIPAGAKIYMHHNANLIVLSDASLKIEGSLNHKVNIQGDRLDAYYKDQPGAWGRIWLSAGSKDNVIDNAVIKNGKIGIHVDTLGNSLNPTLKLSNTIIQNMSSAALFAQGSWVEAYNCVFSNCGEIAVRLSIGGKYNFRHCTIGNYWKYNNRQTPSLLINNYYEDAYGNFQIRNIEEAYFGNCILYGNREEELITDKYPYSNSTFNVQFESSVLKTKDVFSGYSAIFTNCLRNNDPKFAGIDTLYFNILPESPCIDFGKPSIANQIETDIEGNPRIQGLAPDAGAYEKQ